MPTEHQSQTANRPASRLLAVGLAETALTEALRADAELAAGSLAATGLDMLDISLIERIRPDLVLAPLLGEGFDILDVAQSLSRVGFSGRLIAVSPTLPNPRGVLAELRGHCKGFTVEIRQFA